MNFVKVHEMQSVKIAKEYQCQKLKSNPCNVKVESIWNLN